ncbi:MAG: hypothetical protein A2992_06820 [Elusimicrobia bacterium RIFCSPLOWO2_01_FULL_59_12]|nr:MAG: hypothetical protein A2992_06820 [Elusimicrobia bacterium RIFCSPLOWO2_01_FULL_59_12]
MSTNTALAAARAPYLFKPGQSGNPAGRPKSLLPVISSKTKHGEQIIERLVDILYGKVKGARVADQVRAGELLLRTAGWLRAAPEGEGSSGNNYIALLAFIQNQQGRDVQGNRIDATTTAPQQRNDIPAAE